VSAEKINWYVMKIRPIARLEFAVLYDVTQREHPAMVPFEMESYRPAKSKLWKQRKKPLFSSYVFVGLRDYDEFRHLRASINGAAEDVGKPPPIVGLIGFGGKLAIMSRADVEFLRSVSTEPAKMVDFYKPISIGSTVRFVDYNITGKVTEFTGEKVRALSDLLGKGTIIEAPRSKVIVEAA
jgi:hypothetical protein